MLTIREAPVFVAPGCEYGAGTGFEGHEFFEASSIRKVGDTYYFVYSSILMHELCYACEKNVPVLSDLHNTSVIIGTVSCWHICRLVGIDVLITIADNNSGVCGPRL